MFGYLLHCNCHRTTVTSRCLLESQDNPVPGHSLADLHLAVHTHEVARVVWFPSAPYPPAPASLPAYLVPLQLPVVTTVLRHDPRLAAAGERPIASGYYERVVGVALFNFILLSKIRRQAAERQPAVWDVLRKVPPHGGHERLGDEFLRLFEQFPQPLPVQPLMTLLVQKGEVVSAVAAAPRARPDVMEVDLLSHHRVTAQLANAFLPRHDVSLDVDVTEHRALLVADALNVGVHRRLDVELPGLDDCPGYRDKPRPHPPKVEVRQVFSLDGGRIFSVPVPPVVETLFPVPQPVSPLSSIHRPFGQAF